MTKYRFIYSGIAIFEEAKTKFESQFEGDQKVQDYCWDRFLDHVNSYEQTKEDHEV